MSNTSNPKSTCHFCKQDFFTSKLGDHILSNHESELFTDANIHKKLFNTNYLHNPIPVTWGSNIYQICLCCDKVILNLKFAKKHFENEECKSKIKKRINQLQTNYPLTTTINNNKVDISGSVIGNNNNTTNINLTLPDSINTKQVKALIKDIMKLAESNSHQNYLMELQLAKAKQRGIITKEQYEQINDLSDSSDDECAIEMPVRAYRHIQEHFKKMPTLDPLNQIYQIL